MAQPAPRYQQLAAIIGVDDLDKAERTLMRARDDLRDEKQSLDWQVQEVEKSLNELLGEEVSTDEQTLAALSKKLVTLKQSPLESFDEVDARKVALVSQSMSPADTQRAVKVQDTLNTLVGLQSDIALLDRHRRLWDEVEALHQDVERVRQFLFQQVLEPSRRLISDFELDRCPVCLQTIDRETLLTSLEGRIKNAEQIAQKASEIKGLRAALVEQVRVQLARVKKLTSQLLELELPPEARISARYVAHMKRLLSALEPDPVEMRLPSLETYIQTPEVKTFADYVGNLLPGLRSEKKRLEPTERDRLAVETIDLLTRVTDSRQTLSRLRPQRRAKTATYREMVAIYECFVRTKRAEVQKIYRDLESDIKRFFQFLHQGEGYRKISLEVDEDRRASTEIKMSFYDRTQEDPRAFNSEGHLDSLGLCVFLAFVKRFNPGFPLVVLDDVVSSIDSGHRQHVCGLLSEEFGDYQLLITTHDDIWFEELCAHQRAHKREHLFVNLRILDWTLDGGVRLDKYKPRWERIEEKLGDADKTGAAAETRKTLEWFLYEMGIAIGTPVALRRDVRYTVKDLYDPFVRRMRKLVSGVYQSNIAVFQNLEANGIFGNLLVHNNPRAGSASLTEVRSFVSAVRAFHDLFFCDQCGRLVEYHRSANEIKCRRGCIMWETK